MRDFMDIKDYFPIPSQTSVADKKALLSLTSLFNKDYNYLEIGSFLGGSLTPHLLENRCKIILSIDDREKIQPDERGVDYDYREITTQMMIDRLLSYNFKIDKLETFDYSINEYKSTDKLYDIAFIDGEHTDIACYRDFLYTFKLLKRDSICIFHDSYIVYKGIQAILVYLDFNKIDYKFVKILDCDVSVLFFGDTINLYTDSLFAIEDSIHFFKLSERLRAESIIKNLSNLEKKVERIKYK
jgi:hypothetical protein